MRARIVLLTVAAYFAFCSMASAYSWSKPDTTHSNAEEPWMAISAWQYTRYWYPGSGVKLLTRINSTAARYQMTKGLKAKALVDWDPATHGVFPLPAGYYVTVYQ